MEWSVNKTPSLEDLLDGRLDGRIHVVYNHQIFRIVLSTRHGNVHIDKQYSEQYPYFKKMCEDIFEKLKNDQKNSENFSLAALYTAPLEELAALHTAPLKEIVFNKIKNQATRSHYIFLQNLLDENERLYVIKFILGNLDLNKFDSLVAKLIESFPTQQIFYNHFLEIVKALPSNQPLPERIKKSINKIVAMVFGNIENLTDGLIDLFAELVKKGQGIQEALKATTVWMNSPNEFVRERALKVLAALLENKKGELLARLVLKSVTAKLKKENKGINVAREALNLFSRLDIAESAEYKTLEDVVAAQPSMAQRLKELMGD